MPQRNTQLALLALAHVALALVYLLIATEAGGDGLYLAGLMLAHAQVLLVALWAAFGSRRFPVRWTALAATTAGWCWILARPYAEALPLLILGSESAAALVAFYAARGLGVSMTWESVDGKSIDSAPRHYQIRDLLLVMISAAVVFSLLRAALWLEEWNRLGQPFDTWDVIYVVVFRAAYVVFALVGTWAVLGREPALRRGAWLVTFLAGWIALTVTVFPPGKAQPLQFAGQRGFVTALYCGSLLVLQREGLRIASPRPTMRSLSRVPS